MIFNYRNYSSIIFSSIVYFIVVLICFWVMTTMVKKYINNRKMLGRKKAFKESWYHFFPIFVLFVMVSIIFIYGTLTEIGGHYEVTKNTLKMRYILRRFGPDRDIKISDIKNIDLYKQISNDKLGYKKLKEAMEKRTAYKSKEKGGYGGYDAAYIRMKNGESAYIKMSLTNEKKQSLDQYLIENCKVKYKIKKYKELTKDRDINAIK